MQRNRDSLREWLRPDRGRCPIHGQTPAGCISATRRTQDHHEQRCGHQPTSTDPPLLSKVLGRWGTSHLSRSPPLTKRRVWRPHCIRCRISTKAVETQTVAAFRRGCGRILHPARAAVAKNCRRCCSDNVEPAALQHCVPHPQANCEPAFFARYFANLSASLHNAIRFRRTLHLPRWENFLRHYCSKTPSNKGFRNQLPQNLSRTTVLSGSDIRQ